MFKLRTGMLSLVLAVGVASGAQANPPGTVAYSPGMYSGAGMYMGPNGANVHTGPGCVNGVCGPRGNIATGHHGHCKDHCPPKFRHCVEGPPRVRFPRGCPAPVCNPCDAPNWGYFQPCWNPWPWPPDWSHCPMIPPAAHIIPGPVVQDLGPDGMPRKGL